MLWVSYHASHEDKTSVYLARVRFRGGCSQTVKPQQGGNRKRVAVSSANGLAIPSECGPIADILTGAKALS